MRHTRRAPERHGLGAQTGFTLLEVMLALSILAVALVGLISRTMGNVRMSQEMAMLGVITDLTRSKMYDVEDQLLRDGFQDLEQSSEGDFAEEGWPEVHWAAKVEKIELPNLTSLETMTQGEGEAGAEGAAGGAGAGLGGLLGGMGGMGNTGDDTATQADSFISSQFEIIRQVLEASIRKVTLTVTWKVGKEDQEMVVACYFTDPAAIARVIPGFGGGGGLTGGGGEAGGGSGGRGGLGGGLGGSGGRGGSGGGRNPDLQR